MGELSGFLSRVLEAFHNDNYWRTEPLSVPASPEAGVVAIAFLVGALALSAAVVWILGLPRRLRFVPFKAKPWTILVREHPLAQERDEWNIVSIWQEEMKSGHNFQVDKNEQYQAAVLAIRRQGKVAVANVRLSVERGRPQASIIVHERLAKQLGLISDNTDISIPPGDFVKLDECEIDIRNPTSFNPVRLWMHPDPDVRLQWRITAISLVAGIVIPKAIGW